MKKATIAILVLSMMPLAHASRLSHHFDKSKERRHERNENMVQSDMNFADYAFRLDRKYQDGNRFCRDYEGRSRSNPYKNAHLTICDER